MDLASIVSSANDYMNNLFAGTDQIVDINRQAAGIEASNALLSQQMGQNAVIVKSAEQDAALALQAAKQKAGEIYGVDLSKNAIQSQQLADVLNTARTQQAAILQDIQSKKSVGMSDNPMQWLINQFTINDDIAKHNAVNAVAEQASSRITELNQKASQLAQVQEQFQTPVTLASKDALNKNILNAATIQANNSWIKGLTDNVNGIKEALNAPKEMIALQFQVKSAEMAAAHLDVAYQKLNLDREQWAKRVEEKNADDSMILKASEAGARIRLGDNFEGYSAKDLPLIKAAINSRKTNQFSADFNTGMEYLTSGTARLASSPGEAYDLIASGVRMNLPGTMDPVKEILGAAAKEVLSNPMTDKKDVAGVKAAISQRANELLTAGTKEVKPGTDNPFEIRSLSALIQNSPTVQALPITQKLLVPLIQAGVDLSSPDKIFSQIVVGMQSGKISYNEAIEATTIFGIGVKANLEDRQFTKLGFDMPKDGSWFSYKTKVQVDPYSMFGRNEIIDWTKPDSLGHALNKSMVSIIKNDYYTRSSGAIGGGMDMTVPDSSFIGSGTLPKAGTIYYPPPGQSTDIYGTGNKPGK